MEAEVLIICLLILFQAYEKCNVNHNNAKMKVPDDIVKPYSEETLNELGITKEELAASIFKQMQIVLGVIKEDLDHRRKCVSQKMQLLLDDKIFYYHYRKSKILVVG